MLPEKNACLYIRVSTHDQEELSPDAQQRLLLDYCKKNGLSVLKEHIFIEKGISGKKADKRPQFMQMIGMAKSKDHPFDVILVWKFSRFARNQEESIVYKAMLQKVGVEVISVSEPAIEGPFGSLVERIIEWMDEYYSIRLSGEVTRGMTENALRGGYNSQPPMGYKTNKETGIPEIYEPEAVIVRRIIQEYINGAGFLDVARTLNALGYKSRKGNPFEPRTIRYILENPFYMGSIRWNRQNHNDHTIKDISEWIITPGVHEPLITSDEYEHIQALILARTRPYKARGTSGIKHWLSGVVKCSSCGASLVSNALWKGNSSSYQCSRYNKGQCKESHFIKTDKLEQGVYDGLKNAFSTCDIKFEVITNTAAMSDDKKRIMDNLAKLDDKERRIKQAYRDGIDTIEEYKENKDILLKERADLEKLLQQYSEEVTVDKKTFAKQIENVYDIVTNNDTEKLVRANAIRSILSKAVYDKDSDSISLIFKSSQT